MNQNFRTISAGDELRKFPVTGSASDFSDISFSEAFARAVEGDCHVRIFSISDLYENLVDHVESPEDCVKIIAELGYGMSGLLKYLEEKGVVL
ncbi:hypothetical protein [Leptospira adleri]|nr:hypothetical protein [Leptospira adleri]